MFFAPSKKAAKVERQKKMGRNATYFRLLLRLYKQEGV